MLLQKILFMNNKNFYESTNDRDNGMNRVEQMNLKKQVVESIFNNHVVDKEYFKRKNSKLVGLDKFRKKKTIHFSFFYTIELI